MSGKGEIYSFTVIRQVVGRAASKAFEPDIPYVIAWVDLDEGPRIFTLIGGQCPVEEACSRTAWRCGSSLSPWRTPRRTRIG